MQDVITITVGATGRQHPFVLQKHCSPTLPSSRSRSNLGEAFPFSAVAVAASDSALLVQLIGQNTSCAHLSGVSVLTPI
nr:hypothetical transcript [Hymenolepis microstoma]